MKLTELLVPAKNLNCGLAAINHGADAVYIGASRFGARSAAGNSVEDIKKLIRYAHLFRVKVYIAINTILSDNQLPDAESLITELYDAGADAFIIQDMGILNLRLPPVVLHASTQTDNRTPEKIKFLQETGFSRVVLARELTINQISEIAKNTSIELEVFIHGSLCVSYSGQCYISQAMSGRSANRGECAQYCRLSYDLYDSDGNILLKNKHLLSLKDLDLSEHLDELLDAGVSSFKIEGRLKDEDYVKNITAFYRKKLDKIFLKHPDQYKKSSSGSIEFFFEPKPEKSFRRSSTNYFLHGRHQGITQPETPKSIGERLGKVVFKHPSGYFQIDSDEIVHAGDGLCYMDANDTLSGFRINSVIEGKIYPAGMPEIPLGLTLFRNYDHAFNQLLEGKTAARKIKVEMIFAETEEGFELRLQDEDNISVALRINAEKVEAKNTSQVIDNIKTQLSKSGGTIFNVTDIQTEIKKMWFFPASQLNEWRRKALEELEIKRLASYERLKPQERKITAFPQKKLSYLGNVTNHLSEKFYRSCGVTDIMPGFEIKAENDVPLMFTKHCIKFESGYCPKVSEEVKLSEDLYLQNKNQKFRLEFDCKKCEMKIFNAGK